MFYILIVSVLVSGLGKCLSDFTCCLAQTRKNDLTNLRLLKMSPFFYPVQNFSMLLKLDKNV